MSYDDDIEIRSQEVQEVLGKPPGFMLKFGTIILFVLVIAIWYAAYAISYPETLKAPIEVTSRDLPRPIIAERSGYIGEIRIPNEGMVRENELIIAYKASGEPLHVITLSDDLEALPNTDSAILSFTVNDESLQYGESIQSALNHFRETQQSLVFQMEMGKKRSDSQSRSDRRERSRLRADLKDMEKQRINVERELGEAGLALMRNQNLQTQGKASFSDVKEAELRQRSLERELARLKTSIRDMKSRIEQLRNRPRDTNFSREVAIEEANLQMQDAFTDLRNAVETYMRSKMIISPISGQIAYSRTDLEADQYIREGEELMKVIPLKNTEPRGIMRVKAAGSGKVRAGQDVIIKFDSYPFEDFGAVIARVESKSTVLNEGYINILVDFPQDLNTTTGHFLDLKQAFNGTAEIILDEKRIIERLFETFKRAMRKESEKIVATE